jgi:hypothetical protein
MATLGRLVWDFVNGPVSFKRQGSTVRWPGVASMSTLET